MLFSPSKLPFKLVNSLNLSLSLGFFTPFDHLAILKSAMFLTLSPLKMKIFKVWDHGETQSSREYRLLQPANTSMVKNKFSNPGSQAENFSNSAANLKSLGPLEMAHALHLHHFAFNTNNSKPHNFVGFSEPSI